MTALRAGRPLSLALPAAVAAGLWLMLGVRWFDPAASLRPAWLDALHPTWLGGLLLPALLWTYARRSRGVPGVVAGRTPLDPWALAGLAFLLRLPLALRGAAGYLTSDGALSGIVALRIRDGLAHHVFVPAVPYSGSLKSHMAALVATVLDPAQAFALVSLLFFAVFVAGVWRLAFDVGGRRVALAAAGYLVCAPTFVTQYSLSNDGNYVEVLALGTWALILAIRWRRETRRGSLAFATGLLLGLAFWCHLLAVMHGAVIALLLLLARSPARWRGAVLASAGFVLGDLPGLLWNAVHDWGSFRYLLPWMELKPVGERASQGFFERAAGLIFDHAPILFGYDPPLVGWLDTPIRIVAWCAAALAAAATLTTAARFWRDRQLVPGALLLLTAVNLGVGLLVLPYVPGIPRYPLFLMTPLPVFLAMALARPGRYPLLVLLMVFGLAGSFSQARAKIAADRDWRGFVDSLEQAGVRHCYSDFFLAAKISFLSEGRIVCTAKLGPTMTEYFYDYRRRVEAAPGAALVASDWAYAAKIERKLARLGVTWERHDWMKPVLLPDRKVDPEELFPDRSFPWR